MEEGTLTIDMVKAYNEAKEQSKQNKQSLTVDMINIYEKAKKD